MRDCPHSTSKCSDGVAKARMQGPGRSTLPIAIDCRVEGNRLDAPCSTRLFALSDTRADFVQSRKVDGHRFSATESMNENHVHVDKARGLPQKSALFQARPIRRA